MEFTVIKEDGHYVVKEKKRTVFMIDSVREGKLLSLYVRNIYNKEVFGCYQINKWYSKLNPDFAIDFTVYEGEEKLGEIHRVKDGFELTYRDVIYRFYCGELSGKRTLIMFDRDIQIAEMSFDQEVKIRFKNGVLGTMFCALAVLVYEFIPKERFAQEGFTKKYSGVFKD